MTDQDVRQPMNAKDARRQANIEAAAAKARAKAQRPLWKKKRFIFPLILVLLIAIIVATSSGDDDSTSPRAVDTSNEGTAAEVEQAADDEEAGEEGSGEEADVAQGYAIGDTIAMGDLEHTFHGARFSEGDDFLTPDEGTKWLLVDVEVTNNSDESEPISSLMMWSLVDSDNRTNDQTITTDEQGSLDGELGAGRSMRGEIAFEVNADETDWELIFEPHLFGFGQGIYEFSADQVG